MSEQGRLKISPNLAIGFAELLFLQETVCIKHVLAPLVLTFGVVKQSDDFSSLKVSASNTGGFISIGSGSAIDRNFNLITIINGTNILNVPEDGVNRYVVLKYTENTIESGKVSVQEDGLMTGPDPNQQGQIQSKPPTPFSQRLRGAGPFPSKIRFPNSILNTKEYFVRSVIDDRTALLNVADGSLHSETDLDYIVVGSYTPGVIISQAQKEPFITGSYSVELRESSAVSQGLEFLLASVVYENGEMVIVDRRPTNLFKLNPHIFSIEPTIGIP
jgi:hypothetical protein